MPKLNIRFPPHKPATPRQMAYARFLMDRAIMNSVELNFTEAQKVISALERHVDDAERLNSAMSEWPDEFDYGDPSSW